MSALPRHSSLSPAHRRILRAVKRRTYLDDLVVAVRPTDPATVQRVARELAATGHLRVETGSWSGEDVYSPVLP